MSSVSVLILDCNACNWGLLWEKWSKKNDIIKRLIASVTVYVNTHLSTSVNSNLIIIAAGTPLENQIIFSSEAAQKSPNITEQIDTAIRNALKADVASPDTFVHTNYASAVSAGICCKLNFLI